MLEAAFDDGHEVVHGAGLGQDVQRDIDLEVVLDLHDEVHHRHRIYAEIGRDLGRRRKRDLVGIERLQQLAQSVVDLFAGHPGRTP